MKLPKWDIKAIVWAVQFMFVPVKSGEKTGATQSEAG